MRAMMIDDRGRILMMMMMMMLLDTLLPILDLIVGLSLVPVVALLPMLL